MEEIQPIDPARVTKILEGMILLDFHDEPNQEIFINQVYRFCHISSKSTCLHVHEDWIEEFEELELAVHKLLKAPSQTDEEIEREVMKLRT